MAFSRCPFGELVTQGMKRKFFRAIAKHVEHLAIQQLDMGCFTDPKYVMQIELKDLTPVQQPPMHVTPEVEDWLTDWAHK